MSDKGEQNENIQLKGVVKASMGTFWGEKQIGTF